VFQVSPASALSGVVSGPNIRLISLAFVVVPSTKCVYHCHIQPNGSCGPRSFIFRTASA
jgi:hypothetical protein